MKIRIDRNGEGGMQHPIITIDTKECRHSYAIRLAIETALELDGHTPETINEVFGRHSDICATELSEPPVQEPESIANKGAAMHNMITDELNAESTGETICVKLPFKIGQKVWIDSTAPYERPVTGFSVVDGILSAYVQPKGRLSHRFGLDEIFPTKEEAEAALKS